MPNIKKPIAYFIGIGGIGMSALARWFKSHGYDICGSDVLASGTVKELSSEGAKIYLGTHSASRITKNIKQIIYNQAIPPNNPELIQAKNLGIPSATYPESLGSLTKIYKTVAIAGAHGKSTTTSLVSLILVKAKMDPSVIVGTKLKEFDGKNFRAGKSDLLVIEADEWKDAFKNYFPYATLVTNIDREHLDHYKNLSNIKKSFLNFLHNTHHYGLVVLNRDNPHLVSLAKKIKRPVVWYSTADKETLKIKKIIKIPGEHNLSNAVGAYALCRALGVKRDIILKSLSEYTGAWRRSEFKGKFLGCDVFDDYGHHPTEIHATLMGFKEKFPEHKIICVFQPHQRERLKLLFKNFVNCFNFSHNLILLPVYDVLGREKGQTQITSEVLSASIRRRHKLPVVLAKTFTELKANLKKIITDNKTPCVIVMMGAGNINEITEKLVSNI